MLTPQGQAYFHRQLIVLGYDDFAADFWFNLPNPQLSGRKPRECTAHEMSTWRTPERIWQDDQVLRSCRSRAVARRLRHAYRRDH